MSLDRAGIETALRNLVGQAADAEAARGHILTARLHPKGSNITAGPTVVFHDDRRREVTFCFDYAGDSYQFIVLEIEPKGDCPNSIVSSFRLKGCWYQLKAGDTFAISYNHHPPSTATHATEYLLEFRTSDNEEIEILLGGKPYNLFSFNVPSGWDMIAALIALTTGFAAVKICSSKDGVHVFELQETERAK